MDIADTIEPKSDQINADDLIGGPQIITVTEVIVRGGEQPVDIITAEHPDRAYRPSKSMRRVLVAAWGKESRAYVGGRIEIYRDPAVKFGGSPVGGIKISGLSRIPKPLAMALTETRGKRGMHTVKPLPDAPQSKAEPIVTLADVADCTTVEELRALWHETTDPAIRKAIERRSDELSAAAQDEEPADA